MHLRSWIPIITLPRTTSCLGKCRFRKLSQSYWKIRPSWLSASVLVSGEERVCTRPDIPTLWYTLILIVPPTGYRYQRLYMQYKYRGPETAHQLWDVPELQSSTYHVGTQITDHFEVVSKTPESIVVRCGGSPRIREVRPGEGLFEMCTHLSEKEGVVEFGLKSAFFAGLGKADAPPMSGLMKWLHVQYAKLWMEHAIKNVTV